LFRTGEKEAADEFCIGRLLLLLILIECEGRGVLSSTELGEFRREAVDVA
jgi:hypothetical protein